MRPGKYCKILYVHFKSSDLGKVARAVLFCFCIAEPLVFMALIKHAILQKSPRFLPFLYSSSLAYIHLIEAFSIENDS